MCYQARADLQVVTGLGMSASLCSDAGLHVKADVQDESGTRTPVYDSRGSQSLGFGHLMFSQVRFYQAYDKCEVAFVVESLQFEYSGIYFIVAEDPNTGIKYIDESFNLQVRSSIT